MKNNNFITQVLTPAPSPEGEGCPKGGVRMRRPAASLLAALFLFPAALTAQNGVTVSNLVVNVGSPSTVTFNVSWQNTGMPDVWSDTVWVFVDYNNTGTMTRLPLAAGATLTATSPGGEVAYEGGNNKGIWVIGNARTAGSFSATVKLCTDAMHSVSAGMCAYASNYPPVGKYTTPADIQFTGTPPYTIVIKNDAGGTTETRQSNSPFTVPAGYTVQSFTDKTGAPGALICPPPAAPTNPGANSRCGSGTVAFSASVPDGVTIDWYTASSGGSIVSGGYGVTSFSPTLTQTTSYYAEARNTATGCVSATRLPVTATVHAVPVITRSGGDASQTVNQNTAISAITYTASNATGIALSSGSFPTGVNGTPNGVVFTVSGTPTVAGTFTYGVTASHTNGCTSAASTGVLTVNAVTTTPPNAASTQTWTYGTQTWSDRIIADPSNCSSTSTLPPMSSPPPAYKVSDGRYYYNWPCAYNARPAFCQAPWRMPVLSDYYTLRANTSGATLLTDWGTGGYAKLSEMVDVDTNGNYWVFEYHAQFIYYTLAYDLHSLSNMIQYYYLGLQVRCVKD